MNVCQTLWTTLRGVSHILQSYIPLIIDYYGCLFHTQDEEPPKTPVARFTVQHVPVVVKQSAVSKSGWITESMASKMSLLKVRPAPTLNLNLSAAL